MKDLESNHKMKILQMETKLTEMENKLKDKEETIQKRRTEMGSVDEKGAGDRQKERESVRMRPPMKVFTKIDRMVWGANYFFKGISDGPKLTYTRSGTNIFHCQWITKSCMSHPCFYSLEESSINIGILWNF